MTSRLVVLFLACVVSTCGPQKKTPDEMGQAKTPGPLPPKTTWVETDGNGGGGDPGDRNLVEPDPALLVGVYRQIDNNNIFLEINQLHNLQTNLVLPVKPEGTTTRLTPEFPHRLRWNDALGVYVTEGIINRGGTTGFDNVEMQADSYDGGNRLDIKLKVRLRRGDSIETVAPPSTSGGPLMMSRVVATDADIWNFGRRVSFCDRGGLPDPWPGRCPSPRNPDPGRNCDDCHRPDPQPQPPPPRDCDDCHEPEPRCPNPNDPRCPPQCPNPDDPRCPPQCPNPDDPRCPPQCPNPDDPRCPPQCPNPDDPRCPTCPDPNNPDCPPDPEPCPDPCPTPCGGCCNCDPDGQGEHKTFIYKFIKID